MFPVLPLRDAAEAMGNGAVGWNGDIGTLGSLFETSLPQRSSYYGPDWKVIQD